MDRPLLLHPLLHLLVLDVLVFGYDKVVVAVIGRIADRLSLEAKPVNPIIITPVAGNMLSGHDRQS